jgi:cellulose synthase (UDP-forming)
MTTIALAPRGRHRSCGVVVPEPPDDAEKASYAWRSLPFLASALTVSTICVIAAQVVLEVRIPIARPFAVYTLLFTAYQALSIPVNFTGRGFDLAEHIHRVSSWCPRSWPTVDIFLPICGEPLEVLHNTWVGVFELLHAYEGFAQVFVLDDGPPDRQVRQVVDSFGYTYLRRPNPGYHKKSGNLAYGMWKTSGEHVVIFDADFRPRPDFLAETLPYMDDPGTGLVQTPQFFRVNKNQTWVERAAGATLEVFYRVVQVSRDRFGSALCVGTNAVYRREALDAAGGFTQIPYAEDSHTGLSMRRVGYGLVYLPVPLAAGVCPSALEAFMNQQYRWSCGATSLIWTSHMWRVPMSWRERLPYLAGWLWNLSTALRTLTLPMIPIVLLWLRPGEVKLQNAILLIPVVLTGCVLYPLWHNSRWSANAWPLSIAVGWSQVLAIWDYSRGAVMDWAPSRGPRDASRRFRRCALAWNGSLAIAWVALAVLRIEQTTSPRFAVVALLGLANLAAVTRVVFPGKDAS